jgi:hypothetical protein
MALRADVREPGASRAWEARIAELQADLIKERRRLGGPVAGRAAGKGRDRGNWGNRIGKRKAPGRNQRLSECRRIRENSQRAVRGN